MKRIVWQSNKSDIFLNVRSFQIVANIVEDSCKVASTTWIEHTNTNRNT